MMLTYVFHSCFVLETEKAILIFDYWLDLNGVVPPFLKKDKPVYVFSSHFHEDHFNSAIFEWKKQCGDITYILSKDIAMKSVSSGLAEIISNFIHYLLPIRWQHNILFVVSILE